VHFLDRDFTDIHVIVSSLEPLKLTVKDTVKAVCRHESTLTAETALNFCLVQLNKQSSELVKTLASSVEERITEQCAPLAGVLQYLHCVTSCSTATELFRVPSYGISKNHVHQLYIRLQSDGSTDATQTQTLKQQLQLALMQSAVLRALTESTSHASSSSHSHTAAKNLLSAIKVEMAVFESTGIRGWCLDTVYSYLLTVPPTSVEAERVLSTAGLICIKLRSCLDGSTVDTLCFLHAYYQAQSLK